MSTADVRTGEATTSSQGQGEAETLVGGWGGEQEARGDEQLTILVPGTAVPEAVVPEAIVPGDGVPEAAVPDDGMPEAAVPEGGMAGGGAPDADVPDGEPSVGDVPVPEGAEDDGSEHEARTDASDGSADTETSDRPADTEALDRPADTETSDGSADTATDTDGGTGLAAGSSGEVPADVSQSAGETGPGAAGVSADGSVPEVPQSPSAGAWDDGLIARRVRAGAQDAAQYDPSGHPRAVPRQPETTRGTGSVHGPAAGAPQREVPAEAALPAPAEPPRAERPERPGHPDRHESSGRQERQHRTETPVAAVPPRRSAGAASLAVPYAYKGFGEDGVLDRRLAALRRLISLSRPRLPGESLAEAGQVLDSAAARGRLPRAYTAVALAGATGSGKSSLFNALAGARLAEPGMRRPTTAAPLACTWEAAREGDADGLLDRLGVAQASRRFVRAEPGGADRELEGLVLIDLPDHDSVAEGHREQVNELLRLVDAVVWVLDPEKYADALLHERYLRPLAGYAEVTFIVLNQTDRLPGDAKDAVLDDLRRLLDEDGMALGEHGEPGARVLATSALDGNGVAELRAQLADFAAGRAAAALRLSADLDGVVERLRPVCADPAPACAREPEAEAVAVGAPAGLTDDVRREFADGLAHAVGATAAGEAAERVWLRHAQRTCGTPWAQLRDWHEGRRTRGGKQQPQGGEVPDITGVHPAPDADGRTGARVARPVVAQAVRTLAEQASAGLPEAWRRAVREAAWRGAEGLPEALDQAVAERPSGQAQGTAEGPANGLGGPAGHGGQSEPYGLGAAVWQRQGPSWWTAALVGQTVLLALQVAGVLWMLAGATGLVGGAPWLPLSLLAGGVLGGVLLAWASRAAARGPARAHGQREEWRLRQLAVDCGRSRVLEPVAAELLRYREVREQYVIAAGDRRQWS